MFRCESRSVEVSKRESPETQGAGFCDARPTPQAKKGKIYYDMHTTRPGHEQKVGTKTKATSAQTRWQTYI